MDEEADDSEEAKRKRPDITLRRTLRKDKETSVVQTGWKFLCQERGIRDRIEEIIPEVTRIRVETCLFLNLHFIRLLDEGRPIPVIDQNLVGRAMQCTYSKKPQADPDLHETFVHHYLPLCPNRPNNSCLPRIANILLELRNQLLCNIKNHVSVLFQSRHRAFVKLLLLEASPDVPFFGDADEDVESCTRLLTTATLWRPNESVRELLPEYPRIRGRISEAAIECLQGLVDSIRPEVGPLPAAPQSRPHLYVPWMRIISEEFSDRELRSFSLVPHASFSAPFIAITPTTWLELQPKSGKRKAPGELRDAFPSIGRLESGGKTFADRITTDGVSASMYFLVEKRTPPPEDRAVHIHPKQRVVGLDPGKHPDFLTGIAVTGDWDGIERQEEIISLGTRDFYHRAGFKNRTFLMHTWMSRDLDVAAFNENAPSGNTLSLEDFGKRVSFICANLYVLVRFHTARRVRKLRRRVTIKKQIEVDRACKKITAGKKTVVALGAAQVGAGRTKRQCGPCESVKRRLSSHHKATVVMIDEFRTSQVCSTCHSDVGKFAVLKRQRVTEDGIQTVTEGGGREDEDGRGRTSYKTCHNVRAEEFSDRELRSFSLVPHASFSAPFIAVTPTIWPELQPKSGKRKAPGELHDAFPSIGRLESGGKTFADRITTDGVSASVYFLVEKRTPPPEDRAVHIHPKQRVVGLDPGKHPDFLTGIAVTGDWDGIERQEEIIDLGTRDFYHRAGFKKRTFLMHTWMSRDLDVAAFNENAPPGTTVSLEEFGKRVTFVAANLYCLVRFHTARRVRKLRRRVTIKRQIEVDRACKRITAGKKTVVAFGAAQVWAGRTKRQCGPCESVKRRLSSHHGATVVMIDEYRTS
ncbi:hypothetical protein KFL_007780030 [Klebsormidium nitens]|uniref:Uncharacterized protein n=1 Tax=Klebsormidium nitens TaxID=105231 RepID=A0A1Y1IKJ2_KLENI|nr:hypothetical protein KFL_007780030 [Klebsormidium nitens]|eukprot:GAQ91395.1 hypothetical protein KFL_007780030 [Klebsormidium nitens]